MKLPEIHYSQVESLGRHDTGGITALAGAERQKGAVSQQAMNQLAGVAADYVARQENMEYNNQRAAASIELSQWEMENKAKAFYTADEIEGLPDHIKRTITGTDGLGNPVSEPRTSIPAYEVYPLLLEQKLQGMIKEKSENITNPHMRREFINTSEAVAAETVMRASIAAEIEQREYVNELGKGMAADAASKGNLDVAVGIIAELEVSDLEKKLEIEKAEFSNEVFNVNSAIKSRDEETVMEWRQILDDPSYDGPLSEAQRRGAIGDLDARLEYLSTQRDSDWKKQHAGIVNQYDVGIMDGEVTRLDLDTAYALWQDNSSNPNGLTPDEHRSLVRSLKGTTKRRNDEARWEGLIAGFLDGTAPADPYDDDHRDAVDWYVADQGLTRDNVTRLGDLAARTGIIPDTLKNIVNGHILNGDVEKAGVGMHFYNELRAVAPHVVAGFGAETKKVGNLANLFMEGGQDPFAAIELAREWHKDVTPILEKEYKDKYRGEEVESADDLHSLMNGDPLWDQTWKPWDSRSVDANPDMTALFSAMTQKFYPLTKGNLELAQNMAYQSLKETWGISEVANHIEGLDPVGGKRAMKFPPERLLQSDPETVNQAFELYAVEHGLDKGSLMLASDSDTQSTHSWVVISFDSEAGVFASNNPRFDGRKWMGKVREGIIEDNKKKIDIETYRRKARALVDEQAASGVQDAYP